MRENIFCGRRTDNKEWVEGFPLIGTDGIYPGRAFICEKIYVAYCESDDEDLALGGFVEVDPETIGQYIGINDKNGLRIFEGHKVLVTRHGEKYVCEITDIRTLPSTLFGSSVESIEVIGRIGQSAKQCRAF